MLKKELRIFKLSSISRYTNANRRRKNRNENLNKIKSLQREVKKDNDGLKVPSKGNISNNIDSIYAYSHLGITRSIAPILNLQIITKRLDEFWKYFVNSCYEYSAKTFKKKQHNNYY